MTVEVVPGVDGGPAPARPCWERPLAHDFCVISLSDRLTPWEVIETRLACAARGDFALALYNPSCQAAARTTCKSGPAILLDQR